MPHVLHEQGRSTVEGEPFWDGDNLIRLGGVHIGRLARVILDEFKCETAGGDSREADELRLVIERVCKGAA